MQIKPEHAVARLVRRGWQYLEMKDENTRHPKFKMLRPGASEPEWLRSGAIKAIVLHTL
jgi:hypothetical protein